MASPQTIITLTIPARQSREVLFKGTESQSGQVNSVYIASDAKPGDLQGKLVSRSDGSLFEIELLGKDVSDTNNGGVHPWTTEGDAESHLLLYNHSKSAKKFHITISNGKVLWEKEYFLDPLETMEVSFNQLISDKVKDDKGQVLDASVNRGVVDWMSPEAGDTTGRLMVTSRSGIMARNFSCGNFTVICGMLFNVLAPNLGLIEVGGTAVLYQAVPSYCNAYNPQQCYGNQVSSGGSSVQSEAGDPSVIMLSDSYQQYSLSPNLAGMGGGTGTVYVQATAGQCQSSGTGNPVVQVPTASRITETLNSQTATCPSGQSGWYRKVYKIITDQNEKDIASGDQALTEGVVVTSKNDLQLPGNVATNTTSTNADGVFSDTYSFCTASCPANPGESDLTQTIGDTIGTKKYVLSPNTFAYRCGSILVNGK